MRDVQPDYVFPGSVSESLCLDSVRTMFIGDTHGDDSFVANAHKYAREHEVKCIIQLGDFGIDFNRNLIMSITAWLARDPEHRWYWIDGNHDHHDWLDEVLKPGAVTLDTPIDMGGYISPFHAHVVFPERMYYVPRGAVFTIGNTKLMGLGGAHSIDHGDRKAHVSWFEQERISAMDMYRAMHNAEQYGPIGIMITHDAPRSHLLDTWLRRAGYKYDEKSTSNRHNLTMVVDQIKPAEVWHGHYHRRYDTTYTTEDGWNVEVHGVAANVNERGYIDHTIVPGVNVVLTDL